MVRYIRGGGNRVAPGLLRRRSEMNGDQLLLLNTFSAWKCISAEGALLREALATWRLFASSKDETADARECYICLDSGSDLVQPCSCNTYVHQHCFLESIKRADLLQPIICAVCKRELSMEVISRAWQLKCNRIMALVCLMAMVSTMTLGACSLMVTVDTVMSVGHTIAVIITGVVCLVQVGFVVGMWRLFCRRTGRFYWCEQGFVPFRRKITLYDGSRVEIVRDGVCVHLNCKSADGDFVFECGDFKV